MNRWFFKMSVLLMAWGLSGIANAGQVTRVYTKRGSVRIDEGSEAGITKGARVCFFSPAGKKVACGKVRRVSATSAFVGVPKARIKRVKKGFEATVGGGSTIAGGSISKSVVKADNGIDHRYNFKLGYLYSAITPVKYNKLTYNAPEDEDASVSSLWADEGAASDAMLGIMTETEFGIGESMAMSVGLRYRLFRDFVATSDYNKAQLVRYVDIEQTASSMGLYSDFTFLDIAFSPSFFYRMSSGLDIDQSTVKFSATQKHDTESENASIASYSSSLTVLSLRLGMNFNFLIAGPLGMAIGLNALVPATTFGKSASASVKDPQADSNLAGGSGKANDDLVEAVAHDKNSFGAEIFFAVYFAY